MSGKVSETLLQRMLFLPPPFLFFILCVRKGCVCIGMYVHKCEGQKTASGMGPPLIPCLSLSVHHCVHQTNMSSGFRGYSCLCLPSCLWSTGVPDQCSQPQFYGSLGHLNSGSRSDTASTFTYRATAPAPCDVLLVLF